jgi:hypothetical protein
LQVVDINGFKPSPNDIVPAVTYGSHAGVFSTTNAQVNYKATVAEVAALAFGSQLLNISTRMKVLTGDNVLIAGFIITGNDQKNVIVRAMGPLLTSVGVPDALADPTIELHDNTGATIASNDNWMSSQKAEIEGTGIAPGNDFEAAIVRTLAPGTYTAVMRGAGDSTGVGLVEVYDLTPSATSKLANISSRGFVDAGDNVMIAGIIVGQSGAAEMVVRAIGPSLPVPGKLDDPTLELRNASGTLVRENDNWKTDQQTEIEGTQIPPANDLESALVTILDPGNYTAVMRGKNNTTGIGVVEVFNIQ